MHEITFTSCQKLVLTFFVHSEQQLRRQCSQDTTIHNDNNELDNL